MFYKRFLWNDPARYDNNGSTSLQPKIDHFNEVIKGLYVGDIFASQLHWSEFDLVVNCTKHIPIQQSSQSTPTTIRIPVHDSPEEALNMFQLINNTQVLEHIHNILRRGGKVLVHCHAGQQRSCAVVACYLMKYFSFSIEDSVLFIKSKRGTAFYNGINFFHTLQLLHNKLALQT